jgi:D-sedoheptulose 7-phosphate isomerase
MMPTDVQPLASAHLDVLAKALDDFGPAAAIAERCGRELAATLSRGHRLLAAGNGGSAAQAQHLTAELVGRYDGDRPPLSAICLSAETSSLTALINDYAPEELFARQVEAHARAGDVVVLMSTSGRSPNVCAAAQRARQIEACVWAFTGPTPNPLAALADEVVAVNADTTAAVQELHLVALHVLCDGLEAALREAP